MSEPNKWPKFAWAGLSCLVAFSFTVRAQDAQPGKLALAPHQFRTFDGKEHQAELGRLWVRENRTSKTKFGLPATHQFHIPRATCHHREFCDALSAVDPSAKFRAKIRSKLSTLFVSGTLDGITPATQANELRREFLNSMHLLIENGGHETLPSEEVQTIVVEFFADKTSANKASNLHNRNFHLLKHSDKENPS